MQCLWEEVVPHVSDHTSKVNPEPFRSLQAATRSPRVFLRFRSGIPDMKAISPNRSAQSERSDAGFLSVAQVIGNLNHPERSEGKLPRCGDGGRGTGICRLSCGFRHMKIVIPS